MCRDVAAKSRAKTGRLASPSGAGFALVELIVAIGLCSVVLSGFYVAIGQGVRIVKNARDQSAASQLLDQRFETMRSRQLWSSVITKSGLSESVTPDLARALGLAKASETYVVGPYPGNAEAFRVIRKPDGTTVTTGNSMSNSDACIRITATVQWGTLGQVPRVRTISTIFTRGGL